MADHSMQIISLDPQGIENNAFVGNEITSSGIGMESSAVPLPPSEIPPECKTIDLEYFDLPQHNYRRPSMLHLPYRIAITVESAHKKFGKFKALGGVNMNVQEGTIYGLLGSSGCGKTTLLSCLVGLRKIDSGEILICGKPPGTPESGVPGRLVGYMPQEIALNGEFTIGEVCHFFGRLYGMTKEQVDERVEKLVTLLDLKQSKAAIKNMSGGQKRRASFLVALLHEPEILILDEPTVGVDPVLRSSIWNYLRELVDKRGTTVIITTHYIEEMRQADTVGIMRNGVLMTEGSPQELMDSHSATLLEDVVLHYCLKTEVEKSVRRRASRVGIEEIDLDEHQFGQAGTPNGVLGQSYLPNGFSPNGPNRPRRPAPYMNTDASAGIQTNPFNRIRALTLKNFIVMVRSIGFLLFVLASPAFIVFIYCTAIGGSVPVELGLGIIQDGDGQCAINGQMDISCNPTGLDCAFINGLHATGVFTLHTHKTEARALDDVGRSKSWGYVRFGSNFSQDIYDKTLGLKNTNETIEGAKVRVRLDMSTVTTGQIIEKLIYDTYRAFSQKFLLSCNIDLAGRDTPIYFGKPIYGNEQNLKFRNYLAPGMTLAFICFMSTLTCGLAYIVEKKDGMIHRTKVAGVTILEIMISHFVPQFFVIVLQIVCAFLIMFVIYDIPHEGSIWLGFAISLWYGISGIGLGFMASTLFDDEKNAMLCAVGIVLPNFILAGVLFPLDSLPPAVNKMNFIIPGTQPGECFRSILLRGLGLSNHVVYMGFISTAIFIIIYAIITFTVLKIRK